MFCVVFLSSWVRQEVIAFLNKSLLNLVKPTRLADKFIARLSCKHLFDCFSNELLVNWCLIADPTHPKVIYDILWTDLSVDRTTLHFSLLKRTAWNWKFSWNSSMIRRSSEEIRFEEIKSRKKKQKVPIQFAARKKWTPPKNEPKGNRKK